MVYFIAGYEEEKRKNSIFTARYACSKYSLFLCSMFNRLTPSLLGILKQSIPGGVMAPPLFLRCFSSYNLSTSLIDGLWCKTIKVTWLNQIKVMVLVAMTIKDIKLWSLWLWVYHEYNNQTNDKFQIFRVKLSWMWLDACISVILTIPEIYICYNFIRSIEIGFNDFSCLVNINVMVEAEMELCLTAMTYLCWKTCFSLGISLPH